MIEICYFIIHSNIQAGYTAVQVHKWNQQCTVGKTLSTVKWAAAAAAANTALMFLPSAYNVLH